MHIDDEVDAGTAKASAAFGRLHGNVWDRKGIRLDTKLKVYKAVVLPTLLYACETWTVYQRQAKTPNHFHTICLRKLLKIMRQDRIPAIEVLKRAGMQSVHILLKLAQLRWAGHFTRMPEEHLPEKNPLWKTRNGQTLPCWSEEAIQRHPQSLPHGFQHTNRGMGTNCTGPSKVARPHQKRASEYEAKIISEAEQKCAQRKARAVLLWPLLFHLQQTV